MRNHMKAKRSALTFAAVSAVAVLGLAGCAGNGAAGGSSADADADGIGVSLIVKTNSNPFFVAMQEGAQAAAEENGVNLTLAAGKEDGDEDTQIQAIEAAISKGDAGILITPNGPAVLDAVQKARDAGLFVIALDTVPDPADAVDITFATDNYLAGQYIGQWTAATLGGEDAVIGLIDLFDDKVDTVWKPMVSLYPPDKNRLQTWKEGDTPDAAGHKANELVVPNDLRLGI